MQDQGDVARCMVGRTHMRMLKGTQTLPAWPYCCPLEAEWWRACHGCHVRHVPRPPPVKPPKPPNMPGMAVVLAPVPEPPAPCTCIHRSIHVSVQRTGSHTVIG